MGSADAHISYGEPACALTVPLQATLNTIRGLEKCRVIGHNPHFSNLCSLSCLNPKVLPKGILFSACDWWKAVNCGTSHIDSSEAVVYGIPLGLLGCLVTPWVYPIHHSFLGVYITIPCLRHQPTDLKWIIMLAYQMFNTT